MFYHITEYELHKAYGGRYVGTIRKYPYQFWIPCTLRMMPVQESGILFSAQFLKMWTGMSVKVTGTFCKHHHLAMLINIFSWSLLLLKFDFLKQFFY